MPSRRAITKAGPIKAALGVELRAPTRKGHWRQISTTACCRNQIQQAPSHFLRSSRSVRLPHKDDSRQQSTAFQDTFPRPTNFASVAFEPKTRTQPSLRPCDLPSHIMDAPEPEQTPFAAVSAQTSKIQRQYQALLDRSTPFVTYRWIGTGVALLLFFARILYAQGWYIGPLSFSRRADAPPPLDDMPY